MGYLSDLAALNHILFYFTFKNDFKLIFYYTVKYFWLKWDISKYITKYIV